MKLQRSSRRRAPSRPQASLWTISPCFRAGASPVLGGRRFGAGACPVLRRVCALVRWSFLSCAWFLPRGDETGCSAFRGLAPDAPSVWRLAAAKSKYRDTVIHAMSATLFRVGQARKQAEMPTRNGAVRARSRRSDFSPGRKFAIAEMICEKAGSERRGVCPLTQVRRSVLPRLPGAHGMCSGERFPVAMGEELVQTPLISFWNRRFFVPLCGAPVRGWERADRQTAALTPLFFFFPFVSPVRALQGADRDTIMRAGKRRKETNCKSRSGGSEK